MSRLFKSHIRRILDNHRPRRDGIDARHQAAIRQWKLPIRFSEHKVLDNDLEIADVVIGTYTSVLFECYLHLVPSVVIKVQGSFARDMAEEGWALVAHMRSELRTQVEQAVALTPEELLMRQKHVWGDEARLGFVEVV